MDRVCGATPMIKRKKLWLVIVIFLFFVAYLSVYIYGSHSEAFKFVESAMKQSSEIQSRVGQVEDVSFSPFGAYKERNFNDKKRVIMSVDITGSKGKIAAQVSVNTIGGIWDVKEIVIDGKSIGLHAEAEH